jgi:hypothetical protein
VCCNNKFAYHAHTLACLSHTRACLSHTCECGYDTRAFRNHTLRVKITLDRLEITLMRVEITLKRVKIALFVLKTHSCVCYEKLSVSVNFTRKRVIFTRFGFCTQFITVFTETETSQLKCNIF